MNPKHPTYKLDIETTTLDILRMSVSHSINDNDVRVANTDVVELAHFMGKELVYQLTARIASKHLENLEYPADWKEAFKERWFPKWLLEKYPVKYDKYNVGVLYPSIAIPEHQHYVHITKLKSDNIWYNE